MKSALRREGNTAHHDATTLAPASVVVCCHSTERFDETVAAVESVLAQSVRAHQIIVSVDNNPPLAEGLEGLLDRSVIVVRNEGLRGTSATRNVGLAHATGDVVVFLDDDAVAERTWLESLLAPFENTNVMVTGGHTRPAWAAGRAPVWFPSEYGFMIGCTGHTDLVAAPDGQVRNVGGGNTAIRRTVFTSVGGWEGRLGRGQVKTGGEEAELCLRIRNALPGALILHVPEAVIHHNVPRERATLRYMLSYAYNEGIVRAKLRMLVKEHTRQPLAGEKLFLRRLVDTAVPRRLKALYRPGALAQLTVLVVFSGLVATGYARGRLTYR